jgi:hypothetical protein
MCSLGSFDDLDEKVNAGVIELGTAYLWDVDTSDEKLEMFHH